MGQGVFLEGKTVPGFCRVGAVAGVRRVLVSGCRFVGKLYRRLQSPWSANRPLLLTDFGDFSANKFAVTFERKPHRQSPKTGKPEPPAEA